MPIFAPIIAISLIVPNLLLQLLKWNFLLNHLNPRPSIKTAAYSLFGGFFFGASSPGRMGELARGFMIPEHSNLKIASLTILDKGFNQCMVFFVAFTVLAFTLPFPFLLLPLSILVLLVFFIILVIL